MTTETIPIPQQVVRLISQIQCEDIQRLREQREINRQNIALPTTIRFIDDARVINAVSRDISLVGIGLITTGPIESETICELELHLTSSTRIIVAQCIWCKSFGTGFHLSGWKFESGY